MSEDIVGVELLPCPFCGGKAELSTYQTESLWSHDQVTYTRVGCGECDYSLSSEPGFEVEAPERWNTRTLTPEPSAAVDLEGVARVDGINVQPPIVCGYCRTEFKNWNAYHLHAVISHDARIPPFEQRGVVLAALATPPFSNPLGICHDETAIAAHTNRGEVERLRAALEPFAAFADDFVDEEGWNGPMRGARIVDWFGPSQFRAARAALSSPDTVKDVSDA